MFQPLTELVGLLLLLGVVVLYRRASAKARDHLAAAIVMEASELLGSFLGEPMKAVGSNADAEFAGLGVAYGHSGIAFATQGLSALEHLLVGSSVALIFHTVR